MKSSLQNRFLAVIVGMLICLILMDELKSLGEATFDNHGVLLLFGILIGGILLLWGMLAFDGPKPDRLIERLQDVSPTISASLALGAYLSAVSRIDFVFPILIFLAIPAALSAISHLIGIRGKIAA